MVNTKNTFITVNTFKTLQKYSIYFNKIKYFSSIYLALHPSNPENLSWFPKNIKQQNCIQH